MQIYLAWKQDELVLPKIYYLQICELLTFSLCLMMCRLIVLVIIVDQ